jgi:hypothetical protein
MKLESWHDFFVASGGATAALAGLVVVAVSVNIERIVKHKQLPARAAAAVGALVMALVASLICLGTQSSLALGLELIGFGILAWLVQVYAIRNIWQRDREAGRPTYEVVADLLRGQVQTLPFIVAGVLASADVQAASYWILARILAAIVLSMLDAWILLVEILR